ncbi:MAG: Hsp20/alpha crystallin family protein [Candidatus Dojkabacteria bacterium]|nr:Hsp20/alpha crystallin family protein [Candidatus Dojkabacteria bacterium]MDQ7021221.1 Hsp20/alpha crystallin family protein [Candidatus Dojkabacteria bacterium]
MSKNRKITLMRPSQIFDTFMDEFFNTPRIGFSSSSSVDIDMYEDDNNVIVKIIAPGFKNEDLDINIEGDILTVSGTVKEVREEDEKKKKYYMKEIKEESFSRSVTLPNKVDSDRADAKVKDGIVEITLPKLPEAKAKKVVINPTV